MSASRGSWIRRWFRRRLDADPRRWVLCLAALEGLASPVFLSSRAVQPSIEAVSALLQVVGLVLAPALALLLLVVRSRLLYWSGKALGGRARPHELAAALAWADVPVALAAWPGAARAVLRLATVEREAVPTGLVFAQDVVQSLTGSAAVAVAIASAAGIALSLVFVAEAQRFGKWRAALNHVLAVLLGLALLAGGIALGAWAGPTRVGLPLLVLVAASVITARAWLGWRRRTVGPAVG